MPKYNKKIFDLLVSKIGSKKGVYSAIGRYGDKFKAYTLEVIFYFIAAKKGIRISKYTQDDSILPKVDELLARDGNPDNFVKKGEKEIIVKNIGKESPYDFPLSKFKLNQELLEECGPIFKKPYRSSIREALLVLEESIRERLGSDKDGKNLILECKQKNVFKRSKGSEEEGLFFLYAGTIGWLRNPPNHKRLKYSKEEAIKIILFVDYLLELFDELCIENKIKK